MPDGFDITEAARLTIEALGNLVILFSVVTAWAELWGNRSPIQAQFTVADGVINGLSFKLGATLLKAVQVHTWHQIGLLFVIASLRTVLKLHFKWASQALRNSA